MFVDYIKYITFKNEESINNVIVDCENMIAKESLKIPALYREDFKQDLRMKIFNVLQKEIITINDDFVLPLGRNKKSNKYFKNYLINSSKLNLIEATESDFFLFVGEIKIRAYLNRVGYTFSIDYLRKYKGDLLVHCHSLNNTNNEGIEYLSLLKETQCSERLIDLSKVYSSINLRDREFLDGLIKCNTQADYARQINVTQQAVSKRLKKIKEQFNS